MEGMSVSEPIILDKHSLYHDHSRSLMGLSEPANSSSPMPVVSRAGNRRQHPSPEPTGHSQAILSERMTTSDPIMLEILSSRRIV